VGYSNFMQRAIVFGGSGFLGSHVADALSSRGLKVTIFDLKTSTFQNPDHTYLQGDIRDSKAVSEAIHGQDYVLNFAGIANLEEARQNPQLTADINIVGNLNILEALKSHPPKRFIFASTYYVYSEFGSIYRITKQACELFIEDYSKRFQIPYSVLRYGSLYGDRADERNTVYRLVKEALTNKKVVRQGNGEEIREYIHVRDAAQFTYEVMLNDQYKNQHVILSGQQRLKIKELLEMLKEICGRQLEVVYQEVPAGDTDHYSVTPYTFRPKMAFRYSGDCHHDLGQGLLQLMYDVEDQLQHQVPPAPKVPPEPRP